MSYALPTFCQALNNLTGTLASTHATGSGTLALADPSALAAASPTPATPIRLTVLAPDGKSALGQFKVVGLSGSLATVVVDDGWADVALPAGSTFAATIAAEAVQDIHTAIAGLGTALNSISLTPGPKGEPGNDGATGIQGPPGVAHATAPLALDSGSGTLSLATSGVTPGTYPNASVTVDAHGLITAVSAGSGSGGSATPGGSAGSLQYNDAGAFAAAPLTTDGANLTAGGTLTAQALSCSKGYSGCEHFGAGATSGGGANNTAIGAAASGSTAAWQTNNTVIGAGSSSSHSGNTVIGSGCSTSLPSCVLIGTGLTSTSAYSILIGSTNTAGNGGLAAIGSNSSVNHGMAIVVGWGQESTAEAELTFGSRQAANVKPRVRLSGSTAQYNGADLALIATDWVDATPGAQKARLTLSACDAAGPREGLRLEADGSGPRVGFFGSPAAARPTLNYSRTGEPAWAAQLRQALASLGLVADSTTN